MPQALTECVLSEGSQGSHRRSGYFYGSPAERPCVWDIMWRGALDRECQIKQTHQAARRAQRCVYFFGLCGVDFSLPDPSVLWIWEGESAVIWCHFYVSDVAIFRTLSVRCVCFVRQGHAQTSDTSMVYFLFC